MTANSKRDRYNPSFATAAALTYFPPMRRLSISYAGHEPAWYFDGSTQRWLRLQTVSRPVLFDIPLAIEPRTRYSRCVRRAAVGDRLLMITDGVLEAPGANGDLFGRQRLTELLYDTQDLAPGALVPAIIERLVEHTAGAPLDHDDVSIMMLEFVNNLERSAFWTAVHNRLLGGRRATSAIKDTTRAFI